MTKHHGEQRDPNPPPQVWHTVRGLDRWLERRRKRGVPELGYEPSEIFHFCSEGCVLHDHKK